MSDTYEDGRAAGIVAARRDLAEYQRIALRWAGARLSALDGYAVTRDVDRGYLDGYRSVLAGYIASQTK